MFCILCTPQSSFAASMDRPTKEFLLPWFLVMVQLYLIIILSHVFIKFEILNFTSKLRHKAFKYFLEIQKDIKVLNRNNIIKRSFQDKHPFQEMLSW